MIVSFLHDLVKSLGGDERRSRSSRMLPMPLLPNDSQGGEVEGEGTPPSLRRLAGTAEGSEDASKEALQVGITVYLVILKFCSIPDNI